MPFSLPVTRRKKKYPQIFSHNLHFITTVREGKIIYPTNMGSSLGQASTIFSSTSYSSSWLLKFGIDEKSLSPKTTKRLTKLPMKKAAYVTASKGLKCMYYLLLFFKSWNGWQQQQQHNNNINKTTTTYTIDRDD